MYKSFLVLALLINGAMGSLLHAESFTTNIISGFATNTGNTYIVGNTGSSNYLEIRYCISLNLKIILSCQFQFI